MPRLSPLWMLTRCARSGLSEDSLTVALWVLHASGTMGAAWLVLPAHVALAAWQCRPKPLRVCRFVTCRVSEVDAIRAGGPEPSAGSTLQQGCWYSVTAVHVNLRTAKACLHRSHLDSQMCL